MASTQGTNTVYNRAARIERLRDRIPLGHLIEFPCAMTPAQLQEIPKVTITNEHAKLKTLCTVCSQLLKRNELEVRQLPCNHIFHEQCIFPWLKDNPFCPTCRHQLVNREDEDFEDVIGEHFNMLTRDLMRHLAEQGVEHSPESDSEHESGDEPLFQVPATLDADIEMVSVQRANPRRAAALHAASAIKEMYRSGRTVKDAKKRPNISH